MVTEILNGSLRTILSVNFIKEEDKSFYSTLQRLSGKNYRMEVSGNLSVNQFIATKNRQQVMEIFGYF